ncbi:AAA family ATPase [Adlercreutzia sp. ZJ138]|uniref:AAA family ATPase n=1 Tax=Adlercreutzia sp. ZJ138 TaxID=2709405 RepID=UPI0013EBC5E9|nr:AAA family ATPase [Adlercreutzia sp. ZJ138]
MDKGTHGIYENGIFRKGNVRISDLACRKVLPVGNSSFTSVVENAVFVDKSMLIADVLDSGSVAMLFCRPRRFGKSLNLSMLQRFFEIPSPNDFVGADTKPLFCGLAIWDAEGGRYREYYQAYPVIRFSFNNLKSLDWEGFLSGIAASIAAEYRRHGYLAESDRLSDIDQGLFARIATGETDQGSLVQSLLLLSTLLARHYGRRSVVLIDEYDAPVMAGHSYGYYDEVVAFLKAWLTGALKDNEALAFAVLTGVQRISRESIFSDLNNLVVNTSLNVDSDERYGFTKDEVDALAEYCGTTSCMDDVQAWYDGYRFGKVDVYNPWSVVSCFSQGYQTDVYWGNTSSNSVIGEVVRNASEDVLAELFSLLEQGGTIASPLDLRVVFPDLGVREEAVWSMLYLAGYLTTDDTEFPNDTDVMRLLRIPNLEVAKLFRSEILQRFSEAAGGRDRLSALHRALICGEAQAVQEELTRIMLSSASFFDLTRENSYHMLMLGLLFGLRGYADPVSNREAGRGRFDILLTPCEPDRDPAIVIELKYAAPDTPGAADLAALATAALTQAIDRAYGAASAHGAAGVQYFGVAASGKNVVVACA